MIILESVNTEMDMIFTTKSEQWSTFLIIILVDYPLSILHLITTIFLLRVLNFISFLANILK